MFCLLFIILGLTKVLFGFIFLGFLSKSANPSNIVWFNSCFLGMVFPSCLLGDVSNLEPYYGRSLRIFSVFFELIDGGTSDATNTLPRSGTPTTSPFLVNPVFHFSKLKKEKLFHFTMKPVNNTLKTFESNTFKHRNQNMYVV